MLSKFIVVVTAIPTLFVAVLVAIPQLVSAHSDADLIAAWFLAVLCIAFGYAIVRFLSRSNAN